MNTTSSSGSDVRNYINFLRNLGNGVSFWVLVISAPVGLIGNLISIIIYSRASMNKKTNTGILYLSLSVVNSISILNYLFLVRNENVFGYSINITCGLLNYLRRTIFNMTSWLHALICFDRFLSVHYPSKMNIFQKRIVVFACLAAILLLILAANSTNLINFIQVTTRFNNATNRTTISTSCGSTSTVNLLNNFIAILMRIYIPFLLMIGMNIEVIKRLKASKIKANRLATNIIHNSSSGALKSAAGSNAMLAISSREYSFMIATISMDFVFLTFFLPVSVNLTLGIVNIFTGAFNDPLRNAQFGLYSNLSQLFAYLFHVCDPMVFFIFNRSFRNEFFAFTRLYNIFPSITENTSTYRVNS